MDVGFYIGAILFFAVASALVAGAKDRSVAGWFVLGLLFSVFAFMIIAVLPSLRPTVVALAGAPGGASAPASEPRRVPCPHCAEAILPDARKCRFCGEAVTPARPAARSSHGPASVTCRNCGKKSAAGARQCAYCGESFPIRLRA